MARKNKSGLLTEGELELMLVLWSLGEGSVRDVLAGLSKKPLVAYTTASTIIRILEKKGFVSSRKLGKAHIYMPLVTKQEYESRTLGHVMGKLFDKSPASLVACLIKDEELSDEEIREIRKLLNLGGGDK